MLLKNLYSILPLFIKERLQAKYSFTAYYHRTTLVGSTETELEKFFEIDFQTVRRKYIVKYGIEPSFIRCEYDRVHTTKGALGWNFTIETVSAPAFDFVGTGAEIRDAYMAKLKEMGTRALTIEPKSIIWADAITIKKLKAEYRRIK